MLEEIKTIAWRSFKKTYASGWYLLIPILLPLALIFLIGSAFGSFVQVPGVSYTQFLGPGFIALFLGAGGLTMSYNLIEDRKGFIKRLLVAPISRYSILFGEIAVGSANQLIMGLIWILLFSLGTKSIAVVSFLSSIALIVLIMVGFYGFGVWFSSLFINQRRFRLIYSFFNYFLWFLSGAFYPIKTLPIWLKIPVYLNPLTYAADALRFSIIGTNEISIIVDVGILLGFTILSVFLGTYMFERNLKR